MKLLNHKTLGLFTIGVLLSVLQVSCTDTTVSSQIDTSGTPQITGVRYVSPDSSQDITKIGPGDAVALMGSNMNSATQVYFNGIEASFNPSMTTEDNLIVTVPADLPFGSLDPEGEEMNTIKVANENGESQLDFQVLPPAPQITSISDEFAEDGKQITIGGQYLYLVTEVQFPGEVQATEFEASDDGTSLTVTVPDGSTSGDITIATSGGQSSTAPGVAFRDNTGMINNFDDVMAYAWWGAPLSSDGSLYPGNEGQFAIISASGVASGSVAWWDGARSVNLNPTQWIDPSDLGEAPSSFAIKFEIFVQDSWDTGTLAVKTNDPWTYTGRIEPWRDSGSSFTTNGWRTVQIPLDEFKTEDGMGEPVQSLSTLLPNGEAPAATVMLYNDTEGDIDELSIGIDNMRVVRIAN